MNSNYNDIVDIILTLIQDEDIANSIAISGSIVPYIITNKESEEYHSDLYILVKEKKINDVRKKVKKLSKEYDFNMTFDSIKYQGYDCGFRISYENTVVGFFPYSLINNNFTIKSFSINSDHNEIRLKTKLIPNISKSSIIRIICFRKNRQLRIMSPEFILADKEMNGQSPGSPTEETIHLLNKISDESILKVVMESISNAQIKVISKKIKKESILLNLILAILFIVLFVIAYICFKK